MSRLLILIIFIFILAPSKGFSVPAKTKKTTAIAPVRNVLLSDSTVYPKQDKKKDREKEKAEKKKQPDLQEIREVPKARNQGRPPIVIKPNVKVKPIKVIRPNIKRP